LDGGSSAQPTHYERGVNRRYGRPSDDHHTELEC
jgi:hypothetical protein